MSVTRLRSEKGSFVQSPRKAFDTESVSVLSAIVGAREDVVSGSRYRFENATTLPEGEYYGVDYYFELFNPNDFSARTRFDFSQGVPYATVPALHNALFTGLTSGATWVPAFSGTFFFGECVARGVYDPPNDFDYYGHLYVSADSLSVDPGLSPKVLHSQMIEYIGQDQDPPIQSDAFVLNYHTNTGRFSGSPHGTGGFLLGESVSIAF